MENYKNVSQDIRDQLNAKLEAVQIILTGIDNDIYSTVDACPNACEMWKAIERLKQGESINVQDLETNLYWEFGKFTSRDGQCPVLTFNITPAMAKVCVICKRVKRLRLSPITRLYDILKQHQKKSQQSTRNRGKAIVTSSAPTYDPEPATVTEDDEMSKEKEIDKLMALISSRSERKSTNLQQQPPNITNTSRYSGSAKVGNSVIYNCKEHIGMLSREIWGSLNAEQADWMDDMMMSSKKQELSTLYVHAQLSEVEIECAKAKGDLMSYKIDFAKSSNAYTQQINDLNQTILDMKKELCAHQETISIISQAKEAQIKLYKTREDKELDKVIALENKVKVLNDIVYKTGQSVQTMNMLNRNCKTSFAKPEFLKKAQRANPRLYDIGCYNDNLALMLAPDSDETIRLDKERRSKLSDLIRPFDYAQLNNLYDLFVPQREKSLAAHSFQMSTMSQSSSNNDICPKSLS
ncbi:hypothetical protein Tco_0562049 [Tanacetum coccineum]